MNIKFVYEQDQQNIIRIQQKLLECYNVEHGETSTLKYLSKQFMKADLTAQKEKHTAKVMHGYYERKSNNNTQIDKHLSNYWKKDKFVTSQQKDYLPAIQDQELPTKYLRHKRARDSGKTPDCNNKCRLCTINVEDISHVIAGCSHVCKVLLSSQTRRSSQDITKLSS